jgi:hypothetical protein
MRSPNPLFARVTRGPALLILAGFVLVGCSEKEKQPAASVPKDTSVSLPRQLAWGEDYGDLLDGANSLENTLDLAGLEKLFGAKFSISTPFCVNDYETIDCCQVPFGDQVYYVTRPMPIGSRHNTVYGYEFYLRRPTSMSIVYDQHRRLASVAFRDGIFGSTRQHFVTDGAIEPAAQLALAVKQSMMKAMKGDHHPDPYWRKMPAFTEKFILAVDNHVIRAGR